MFSPLMHRHVRTVLAEIADRAGAGRQIAADDFEQGRFASAIGADQTDDLAVVHRE
jgi:hypothetical protein